MKKSRAIFFIRSYVTIVITLLMAIALLTSGCKSKNTKNRTLVLATTTSVQDTGLLDEILPKFEKQYGVKVKPIAVGSGEALKMGEEGNVDSLLVHSPKDEEVFMKNGFGLKRKTFMYNYFMIVGPENDPAGIGKAKNLNEALNLLAGGKGLFVSRGDDSGTNKKELKLWESAGKKPQGKSYIVSGQGMGETLQIASEKQAYTLTDKATFLSMEDKLDLKIYYENDKELLNKYSVIVLNYNKFKVNKDLSVKFYNWITSKEITREIGNFKKGKLFFSY